MPGEAHDLPKTRIPCPECGSNMKRDPNGEIVVAGWYYCIGCDAAYDPEDIHAHLHAPRED